YSFSLGPSYISAHSADVILSDIRPIKLKAEALRTINALLDEFLSKILNTSCSLATDKLRASLLALLPTSLGKEALLEAEVELRAYWERTDVKVSAEDDSRMFHHEWAFELLRQKCEAYSTLNEEDEDPAAEARINERFGKVHPHPPSNALLDPAALYLTAILESMCEHILSNVGRVAARDSSRTSATVNDLFVALCEDDSIYGLFRLMKVYEQIELLSKTPKTRRSKSFSRSDRLSMSRTSSPQHDLTSASSAKSRQSFDGQSSTTPSSAGGSRASFEKARAIRMFSNGRSLGDIEVAPGGHKKSESLKSESLKSFPDDETLNPAEDAAMLREFDDLMRSASTMKVSLTPDRLKTMEVYKQEKDQRSATRRPGTHFSSNSEPDIPPASRANSQRLSIRHVDSIVEDEEEQNSPQVRPRRGSNTIIPPVPALSAVLPARARSVSTSSALQTPVRKPLRNPSLKAAPSSFSHVTTASDMVQTRDIRYGKPSENNGFPPRTRVRQRNRDSLDLDDVMNGSDDDQEPEVPVRQQPQSSPGPRRANAPPIKPAVSAKTRELMDFLAEGPPESGLPQVSKNGKELMDFLADGPPDFGNNSSTIDPFKPKGAGRLQRMISKLNLGNGEKVKTVSEGPKTPHSTTSVKQQQMQPPTPIRPNGINTKSSMASLANRPIPPRPAQLMQSQPPPPLSPPSSPHDSSDENKSMLNLSRKPYYDTSFSRDPSLHEKSISERASPVIQASPVSQSPTPRPDNYHRSTPPLPSNRTNGNGSIRHDRVPKEVLTDVQPFVPVRTTSIPSPTRKPAPSVITAGLPAIPEPDVRDMQRLLANATTADECRLIFDMYMARNGIPRVPKASMVPYPSPSPSVVKHAPYVEEATVENSLVELFLGGMAGPELPSELVHVEDEVIDGMPVQNDGSITANSHHDHNIVSSDVSITPGPQTIPLRA
ncbi:hypothetical protein CVT25_003707, partial [Psilocybe cyanescens]